MRFHLRTGVLGVRWVYSSELDLAREPKFGRVGEMYGEVISEIYICLFWMCELICHYFSGSLLGFTVWSGTRQKHAIPRCEWLNRGKSNSWKYYAA